MSWTGRTTRLTVVAVLAGTACANEDAERGVGALGGGDAASDARTIGSGGGPGAGTGGGRSSGGATPDGGTGGATPIGGAGGATEPSDDGGIDASPAPSDAGPDGADSPPSSDAGADAPASALACGSGIFTHPHSHEAAYSQTLSGNVWFGGDDRTPTVQLPQLHPRNVATGLELSFTHDTLVETLGFFAVAPFTRASDGAPASVTIRSQVRDVDGTILSEAPPVTLPASFPGGYFDVPVHALLPAGVARVFTLYVEGGMPSGLCTSLAMQGIGIPDEGVIYRAILGDRADQPPEDDLQFVTKWEGLWSRSYSGSYPTLRFRLSGCQEICAGVDCDDGNACTDDVCQKSTGTCVHTDTDCGDGIACTVDSCALATGCRHLPDASRCPDQPHCNQVKACSPVTGCGVDCGDGTICTVDTCNESTDQCDHAPAEIEISLTNDLSYDVGLLRCGESMGDPYAQCVLSEDGQLQLRSDSAENGDVVTSGCSDGNNMSCCFE